MRKHSEGNDHKFQRIPKGETVYINLKDHMETEDVAEPEDTHRRMFCLNEACGSMGGEMEGKRK